MKKFVNDPQQFVPEMLKGVELANPGKLRYVPEYNLIMRSDAPNQDKVSIVQGSGSGHEPAHVMVVGKGMLDAACPGDVFAAPPSDYVYETTKLLASPKGVLHIINNYTGDRMAFDMGRELAEADDIKVATIVVDDDVAVKDSTYTVGRRGVAGNFFVIKAVGAASENGASLEELVTLGERVNSVTRTMGMALTSCTPPAKGSPLFELGDDEMEMGVGIHGEPGRRREKLANANAIIDELLEAVVTDLPYESGDDVALMINGLGGTPISELYILYGRAYQQLADRGINVTRSYVGEYCTSLDMAGASVTLVKLDDELNALFDAPAEVAVRVFDMASGRRRPSAVAAAWPPQRHDLRAGELPLGGAGRPREHRRSDRSNVGDHQRGPRAVGDGAQRAARTVDLVAQRLAARKREVGVGGLERAVELGDTFARCATDWPSQLPRSDSIRSSSTTGSAPTASPTVAAVCRARCSGEVQIATTPALAARSASRAACSRPSWRQGRVTAAENLPDRRCPRSARAARTAARRRPRPRVAPPVRRRGTAARRSGSWGSPRG